MTGWPLPRPWTVHFLSQQPHPHHMGWGCHGDCRQIYGEIWVGGFGARERAEVFDLWKPRVVMTPHLLSLAEPQIVFWQPVWQGITKSWHYDNNSCFFCVTGFKCVAEPPVGWYRYRYMALSLWEDEPDNNKGTNGSTTSRSSSSNICLMAAAWCECCIAWLLRHHGHRWVSVVIADGLVPIGYKKVIATKSQWGIGARVLGRFCYSLQWRHNEHNSVSNHQPHDCLLNRLFRCRSKKTSKLRVTGLCARNSPGTGEFPAQMASNAENISIWWRHHV